MSKYLVRPGDFMIFERIEGVDCYEIIDPPTDRFGNKPIPFAHFTEASLKGHGFFEIDEDEIEVFQQLRSGRYRKISEGCRKQKGCGDYGEDG